MNRNHYIVSCPSRPLQFRAHPNQHCHCQQPARSWTQHWFAFPPGSQQRNFLQKKHTQLHRRKGSSRFLLLKALHRLLQPLKGSYSHSKALTALQRLLQPFKGSYSLTTSHNTICAEFSIFSATSSKDSDKGLISKSSPKAFLLLIHVTMRSSYVVL